MFNYKKIKKLENKIERLKRDLKHEKKLNKSLWDLLHEKHKDYEIDLVNELPDLGDTHLNLN